MKLNLSFLILITVVSVTACGSSATSSQEAIDDSVGQTTVDNQEIGLATGSTQEAIDDSVGQTTVDNQEIGLVTGSTLKESKVGIQFVQNEKIINKAFYIDPVNGSSSGDGSKESPWGSFQEVIDSGFIESRVWSEYPAGELDESYLQPRNEGAPITGGDTIYLMSGNYGDLSILKYYNTEPIVIKAYPGQKPVFSQIILTSSANWHFEGITIDRTGLQLGQSLFIAENHGWTGSSWDISLLNSHLTGSKDINSWGLQEWLAVGGGIRSNAERFTAIGNTIENVRHAVTIENGVNTLFEYNTINQFAFDAIRSFGSHNSTYQYNLIKNSVYTDYSQNHDDAFQSWMLDGKPESGYIIHGNVIIDNYDLDKSPSPFLANRTPRMQAIGLFDGPFWDWQITNNTIIVSSSHGISTDKFKNGTISDNVLMQNPKNTTGGIPWISLGAKTGTDVWPVTDNVITNNVMSREIYIVRDKGIIAEENTLEPNYIDTELNTSIFIDYPNGDFQLNEGFQQEVFFVLSEVEEVSNNLKSPSSIEIKVDSYGNDASDSVIPPSSNNRVRSQHEEEPRFARYIVNRSR